MSQIHGVKLEINETQKAITRSVEYCERTHTNQMCVMLICFCKDDGFCTVQCFLEHLFCLVSAHSSGFIKGEQDPTVTILSQLPFRPEVQIIILSVQHQTQECIL